MIFNKYMRKYYLKYLLFYIIGIAALIIVDVAQLFIPTYIGDLVNIVKVMPNDAEAQILNMFLKILIISLVMFAGRMIWRFALFNASFRIESGLRHEMFTKSERLSPKYYHETKVGNIMSWFTSDLEQIEGFCGFGTVTIVDAFFLGILVLVLMFKMDWVLTLIAVIPMLLLVIWGFLVEKYMSKMWENRQAEFDKLYDYSQETFTGIRVIKAFVKKNAQMFKFAKIAKSNKDMNVKFARVNIIFDVCIELIILTIISIIMAVGGYAIYSTITNNPFVLFGHTVSLDVGELVTFTGLFDLLIWPMIAMGQIVAMYSRASASLKRIQAFLDANEDVKNPENAIMLSNIKGKIEFRNFSFKYPDSITTEALHNVSFTINPGEMVGVVGKIGCGKTTLVNVMLRLYNVDDNSIFIDDNDLMKCDIKSIRDSIAYVPQDNFLFSDKISNNIAFSNRKVNMSSIVEAANFADIHENIRGFKAGYDTISGERGVTLSGGQKQRISIARAYLKHAPIMILDDSVSAVDVKTEETILNNIKEKRKNLTTIIIASRVSTVHSLDKILVLNEGKVEAFGTPSELLKISPTYERMVFLQKLESEVEGGLS